MATVIARDDFFIFISSSPVLPLYPLIFFSANGMPWPMGSPKRYAILIKYLIILLFLNLFENCGENLLPME
jgi:hypothetical protein